GPTLRVLRVSTLVPAVGAHSRRRQQTAPRDPRSSPSRCERGPVPLPEPSERREQGERAKHRGVSWFGRTPVAKFSKRNDSARNERVVGARPATTLAEPHREDEPSTRRWSSGVPSRT